MIKMETCEWFTVVIGIASAWVKQVTLPKLQLLEAGLLVVLLGSVGEGLHIFLPYWVLAFIA